ncbi:MULTISPECIES: DUF1292 domain-containing protein [Clostridium]|uniref:DUF1292 domain-containing protein n=1 Tax=Clostridium ragsdalei P11 TaxID=1353534 RepID=A0A1A6AYA1_9CLOT|nr:MULTISPECIES: DUF1292 domain-containing protein [Clostridium]OBR95037.1 hypothetical protein CLRAG_13750 [Clostridium ragsdalei P11]QXE20207.1 hypothetical protein B5S50_15965 [Clostridium sp. 001]
MDKENLNECNCGCTSKEENCGCTETHEHEHDCGCGCGCEDSDPLIVDLEDENGEIVSCEIVDGFEYKEGKYAVVENPENGSTYLFKVENEGELVIPEDNEFDEVSKYYEKLMEEE